MYGYLLCELKSKDQATALSFVMTESLLDCNYNCTVKSRFGPKFFLSLYYGLLLQVSASLDMAEENKAPKLTAERTWNYDFF